MNKEEEAKNGGKVQRKKRSLEAIKANDKWKRADGANDSNR